MILKIKKIVKKDVEEIQQIPTHKYQKNSYKPKNETIRKGNTNRKNTKSR